MSLENFESHENFSLPSICLHINVQSIIAKYYKFEKKCYDFFVIRMFLRTAIIKTTREKIQQQNKQNKHFFTAKIQHLKLKARSNNVKIQSDKTIITQMHFLLLKGDAIRLYWCDWVTSRKKEK